MKLIIAGSRTIQVSIEELRALVDHYNLRPTEIISGTAQGIDRCGESYARSEKLKLSRFPAQWELYGKAAGMKRNAVMAEVGDALLLIWDGKSRGSAGMKLIMQRMNKPIYEIVLEGE
jgi:hypothetical protein